MSLTAERPRVLHLFSNAKWTGPAEPALNLCVSLRALGVDADFACSPDAGASVNKVVETARDRGVEPILTMRLGKHRNLWRNFLDQRALLALLADGRYNLVHCHLDNAHAIAEPIARRLKIPLIRSNYEGDGLPPTRRSARLLRGTRYLLEPSLIAQQCDAKHLRYPADRMQVVPGAVDVHRFDATRELPDGRRWLGIPPDAFVVGIVARMQTHRHFEDLWAATRRLVDEVPNAHVLVVGRGTNQLKVGMEPVERLGLSAHVHFPGYVDGENYVGMLRAFDVGVYLVPGSDGTCRAAREIMAMGRPMVVADRGMLREIVTHGQDGLVFDGSPDGLQASLRQLARDRGQRVAMGRAARQQATRCYSLEAQGAAVLAVYDEILASTPALVV